MVERTDKTNMAMQGITEEELATSNLELEFNVNNKASAVMGKYPDKVSFIIALGPLKTNNLTTAHEFQQSVAIGFYNQVSIYGVQDHQSLTVLKEITVTEIAEDLVCATYSPEEQLLAFGGALSVGYIYNLAGGPSSQAKAVTIALDSDDETQRPEGLVRLNGHFKQIDCIEFRPLEATRALNQTTQVLTASQDFSIRLWEVSKGIQLALFLDINTQNSEVLSISWAQSGWRFLSLDVN